MTFHFRQAFEDDKDCLKGISELRIRRFCIILRIKLRLNFSDDCIFLIPDQIVVVIMLLLFKNFYIPIFASLEPSTV